MKHVDMSSEAVTRRLRRSSDLRDLCVALMKAKRLGDKKAPTEATKKDFEHEKRPDNRGE